MATVSRLRFLPLLMLGLLLGALVVRHSLVAYTSTSGPPLEDLLPISSSFWLGKAVRATQSETDALGRLEGFAKLPLEEDAKTVASTPSIPAEPSQITSWYFEALRRHPLSGRAFVSLGQLEVQSGDKARARRPFMRLRSNAQSANAQASRGFWQGNMMPATTGRRFFTRMRCSA
jgi:hypothetical protein